MFSILPYALLPSSDKTTTLMDVAVRDHAYTPIITALTKAGYSIKHTYWGRPGAYIPSPSNNDTPAAHFRFSYRHGFNIVLHTFLHELVHFKQHQEGRLPSPSIAKDEAAYIAQTLVCEIEAETQALAASWRLKQAGSPQAWRGAMLSFDWRSLAKAYEQDREAGLDEEQAIENSVKTWHGLPQSHYYTKRAQKIFKTYTAQNG